MWERSPGSDKRRLKFVQQVRPVVSEPIEDIAGVRILQGAVEYAVEAAFTQGSILVEHEQWLPAAAAYQQVLGVPFASPRAADAGLMHAWCLGRMYQSQPTETKYCPKLRKPPGNVQRLTCRPAARSRS